MAAGTPWARWTCWRWLVQPCSNGFRHLNWLIDVPMLLIQILFVVELTKGRRDIDGLGGQDRKDTATPLLRANSRQRLQPWPLLCYTMVGGWLEVVESARKLRRDRSSAEYRQFIGGITAL